MTRILLTILLAIIAANVSASDVYYHPRVVSSGGCSSYRCGTNAKCSMTDGRPVCSCLNLHMGDPLIHCHQVECIIPEDCPSHKTCKNNHCVNPCAGLCGINANCEVINHVPTCSCPAGYTGHPYESCQVADPQALCKPNPCGVNTRCEVINEVPVCSCLPGYRGSAIKGCYHECESDAECPHHLSCSSNFKCESPCKCGDGANCDVINHQAKCSCPKNWLGSPYTRCYPECTAHSDCPRNKPACFDQQCSNPCKPNPCGVNANCELRGFTPVCSCPKHMTGDPFKFCRPFEPEDLCRPNPCGENAICTPGHDNTGKERPVCTCPTGYTGNALVHCRKGECQVDSECPDNRACIDYYCQNPCTGKECAPTAKCEARRHIAVCTCEDGTRGDAIIGCNTIHSHINGYGRHLNGK